ncbi:MAG: four helix bundle protein [Pyrinomonadaceae bacterium]|nr:four helix bundle protein [Pyrinomonadaceae bacterium]
MKKKDILREKSFAFALRIVRLQEFLNIQREFLFANQIFRSGTSIGANLAEARQAQSYSDFIHKLSICNKEAAETRYWIELLGASKKITKPQSDSLLKDCAEIQRILVRSIRTAKRNKGA